MITLGNGRTNGCRSGVEDIDLVLFNDLPVAARIRIRRRSFEKQGGAAVRERAIYYITMPSCLAVSRLISRVFHYLRLRPLGEVDETHQRGEEQARHARRHQHVDPVLVSLVHRLYPAIHVDPDAPVHHALHGLPDHVHVQRHPHCFWHRMHRVVSLCRVCTMGHKPEAHVRPAWQVNPPLERL